MKKLYYFYHEIIAGEIFVDVDGNYVQWVHENDACWSSYFDFISEYFGGNVVELNGYDLISEEEISSNEENFSSDEEIRKWVLANKKMILEAIKCKEEEPVEVMSLEEVNLL